MIRTALIRIRCALGHHVPDGYPLGISFCKFCDEGPLGIEDDWAADLFGDDELF